MLAILYYGGTLVQSGVISIGDLTSFFLYTAYVGTSFLGLSSWYSELNKGIGASIRLFSLLESQPNMNHQGKLLKFMNVANIIKQSRQNSRSCHWKHSI